MIGLFKLGAPLSDDVDVIDFLCSAVPALPEIEIAAESGRELSAQHWNMLTPDEAEYIPCQNVSMAGRRDLRTPITREQAAELVRGYLR